MTDLGTGRIASVIGRYYAMDRDNRWDRVEKAYRLLTEATGPPARSATEAVQRYYDHPAGHTQRGDEFITPTPIAPDGITPLATIQDGDSVIFYNYRGDRPREITRAFVMPDFYGHVAPSPDSGEKGFDRGEKLDLYFATMTAYETALNELVHVAFPKPPKMKDIVGQYISDLGLTQFRVAETEKFPHVTFFFNDYRDEPFPGEGRRMAQSPKVATYDLQPEMSAFELRDIVLERLSADDGEDFIIVNFANGDMVGHTGSLEAAITAVETVDECVGAIVDATLAKGGVLIVTADHGNCDEMIGPDGATLTQHSLFKVPFIVAAERFAGQSNLLKEGHFGLADIAPTILDLLGLPQPEKMTGQSIIADHAKL